jgi:uncharacterized membrane protein
VLRKEANPKSQAPNIKQEPNHKHQISNKDQTAKQHKFQTPRNSKSGTAPIVLFGIMAPGLCL